MSEDGTSAVAAPEVGGAVSLSEEGGSGIAVLLERVQALEAEVAQARASAQASDLRRRVETALLEAGAVDVETASLLVERAIAGQETPNVEAAVSSLRAGKGWLFSASSAPGALHAPAHDGGEEASLAAEAAARGDRRALLRYLRLRREE